ncbi:MAG TPA: cyclophilin-like fold protein [Candidatus Binatia bacterium]|nr:cyclophilin-like fold protein [Candidatus Binatia bacterium]
MRERRIRITAGAVSAEAVLNDSETATAVWDALPLAIAGETWGDEIYFAVPVEARAESPRDTVEMGDLGYWPPGSAFCIFFGPTPMSRGREIRPASPVNVLGRVVGDPTVFKGVRAGTTVRVERVPDRGKA